MEKTVWDFIGLLIALFKIGQVASAAGPSTSCFVIISGIMYSMLKAM